MRPGFAVLSFLLFSRVAAPQQYVISTLAGGVPVPPTVIESIAVDAAGNIYFDGRFPTSSVFKLDPSGKVTFIAGSGKTEYRGDGGPATSASLYSPEGLAVDSAGNLYVADKGNHRVRRVSPDGIITTVAGVAAMAWGMAGRLPARN